MKSKMSHKLLVSSLLLTVTLLIAGLSLFFFTRLDQIIHGDLYSYGLQFSYEWASEYWSYSRLIAGLLVAALILTGTSVALTLFQARRITSAKGFINFFLVAEIATVILSLFLFTRLDQVVHGDLYNYGLQFSYEWADQYWNYSRLMHGFLGFAIAMTGISFILITISKPILEITTLPILRPRPRKMNWIKLTYAILSAAGVLALAFAINYNSSILAFVGLGLVFWGVIFLYIRPESHVKKTILEKTTLPSLTNLNKIIELGFKGRAVYLPPRYFKSFESSKAYISAEKETKLPSPETTQDKEDEMIIEEPYGVLITPLGIELKRLFEKTMGISFTKVDLRYLEQNLPKLLVEDLEIAQEAELEAKSDKAILKLKNSIYQGICDETQNLPRIRCSLGCPLCSAIACALAEATGKSVTIEKEYPADDGHTISIEYRLFEPEAESLRK